ncbi:MAG: prepilin-type N-terminal cleavage/methylation domain-containing protein [Candidatus Riflebacteria bacterium]|nr:prepilin-type N-terminal cleavage/methylation domain-containing protein [Candidatus Riflebacteria bacterium]
MTSKKTGFTFVEIMVVSACLALLAGTAFMLLRFSTRSSLQGMLRLETTLEARKIIRQVYADLKLACFPLPYDSVYNFDNVMYITGVAPHNMYTFLSFPTHARMNEIFSSQSSGVNYRETALINYRIEPGTSPDRPFLKLTREETFKGQTTKKVLSERVNFFEIKPVMLQPYGRNQFYFMVTLQLIDSIDAADLKDKNCSSTAPKGNLAIADFFDIVYPEFFHAAWNQPGINPNWHTQIQFSDN